MVPILTEKAKKLLKVVEVLSQLEDSWLSQAKGHLMGIRFMRSSEIIRSSSIHDRQQRLEPCTRDKAKPAITSLETPQPHRAPSSHARPVASDQSCATSQ